jgi:uncharacterized membrane protein
MSDLLVIGFPTEAAAEEVRRTLLGMEKEYLIELGDAVVAVKQPDGRVKLNQIFDPTAASAASGAFWGALIGLLLLSPLAGTVIGAVSGYLGGRGKDLGINDEFMRDVAATLDSGKAALFLLIRKMTTDRAMTELQGSGGTVLRSSFDETKEDALRAALGSAQAAVAAPSAAFRDAPSSTPT